MAKFFQEGLNALFKTIIASQNLLQDFVPLINGHINTADSDVYLKRFRGHIPNSP
jgi:hypothetical protein